MSAELREQAKDAVNRLFRQRESKGFWILEHRADIHCILFHLLVVTGYVTAFFLYLHPDVAHIKNRTEMAAFVGASVLLLGWVSGINLGVNFHNHVHLRLFRVAWLNRWFGRLWAITGCWPSRFWFHAHVTVHHSDTLGPTDWTLAKRKPDGSFENHWKYSLLHWPWRYARHLWQDYRSGTHPGFRQDAPREFLIFCVLYSIPFWIDPMMGLLLWFAPHWVANILILGSGMYVQHVGCEAESDAHPFRTSNTFFSRFFNMATFNIGYHNLHHSFPHIHWSELPEFQPVVQRIFDADDASALRFGYFRATVELTLGGKWPAIRMRYPQYPPARPEEIPDSAAQAGAR